jgi:hypothetical protein
MEDGSRSAVQPSDSQHKQGMTPAGILHTLRELHWFLLYIIILNFVLSIPTYPIDDWITSTISAPTTYIHMSPKAVFCWLYFGTLGFGYCGTLLWLWLSRRRSAASWGWLIFSLLQIIQAPFLGHFIVTQVYVDVIQTASGTSIPETGELVLYGFLFALVPLVYLTCTAVRAHGGKQTVNGEDAVPEQPTDILTVSPGGVHWFVALLLTAAAIHVMHVAVIMGYFALFKKAMTPSLMDKYTIAFFYLFINVRILGFFLWVRITYKRYAGSANWRVGLPVIFIEEIILFFFIYKSFGFLIMHNLYLEYYDWISPERLSLPVVHLIIALALACLPLLYQRRTVHRQQAQAGRSQVNAD